MYERFTDRARQVFVLANQQARQLSHERIDTEHILWGVVREGSGVGAKLLESLGVDLQGICLEVEKLPGGGAESLGAGKLPVTPRAKRVVEYAIEESEQLRHLHVGTEHLLLGLMRVEEGVAARVLVNLGLRPEDVRRAVLNVVGDEGGEEKGPAGC